MAAATVKPTEDPNIRGDAYRTLFLSRLNYDTDEKDLEREFGRYGAIERIRIVKNSKAKPTDPPKKKNRGYAFILYEREKDMKGKARYPMQPLPPSILSCITEYLRKGKTNRLLPNFSSCV